MLMSQDDDIFVAVRSESVEVEVKEPDAVFIEVTPPPGVHAAVAEPEVMVVAAANIGQPGKVGPFQEGHTFAVLGLLAGVTVLPSFFVPKHANQTVKLFGLHGKLVSGSIKIQIMRNGVNVASPITITQAKSFTSLGGVVLADGDEISAILLGPVASPDTLSATVVLEWSVP